MSSANSFPSLQRSLSSVLAFWDRSTLGVLDQVLAFGVNGQGWHRMIDMAYFALILR